MNALSRRACQVAAMSQHQKNPNMIKTHTKAGFLKHGQQLHASVHPVELAAALNWQSKRCMSTISLKNRNVSLVPQ